MKKIALLLSIIFLLSKANAQFVHVIKADSVLITNDSSTAELNLENSTKHVKGFLYNKGNGRTEFRKMEKLNDSTLVFGGDTVGIGGPSSQLTLQQVTGYGNTTSNTIKPYPSALPVGASTDSVVVWSASDSLLKKVAPRQTFAQTSTVTVSATDVQTTLTSSGAGSLTIPPESWFVGKTYKVIVHGTYSTSSTNQAGITIKIKLGTTVVAQGSLNPAANKTDVAFECRNEFTCRATGASGTVFSMGMIRSADNIVTKLNNGPSPTSVTLSTSQALNITAQLTNNGSGNSVSAYLILLEAMN
ncbi:hypothetical protein [Longitalea luteola]|uniref:hypothetical protein n=1 Tax=Longitalea luteola TaxID=2812563 RepID=UPI001A978186|nr:hypothetical protein [Longitalea luteola]